MVTVKTAELKASGLNSNQFKQLGHVLARIVCFLVPLPPMHSQGGALVDASYV